MAFEFPIEIRKLKEYNLAKYRGIPPPWELVQKVIKRSGLRHQAHFEIVWGIARKLLTQYKNGDKVLPCKYWHIFYDFDTIKKQAEKKVKERPVAVKKVNVLVTNKQLLDAIQTGGYPEG